MSADKSKTTTNIYIAKTLESVAIHATACLDHISKREYEAAIIEQDLAQSSRNSFRRLDNRPGKNNDDSDVCLIVNFLEDSLRAVDHRKELNKKKVAVLEKIEKYLPSKEKKSG